MKKANYALSALLLAAAASPAFAVDIYKRGAVISDLQAGQEVLIRSAVTKPGDSEQRYITGASVSASPLDSSLYIVEAATGVTYGGQPTFFFKNKKTGKYLAKPQGFTSTIFDANFSGLYLSHSTDLSQAVAFGVGAADTTNADSPFFLNIKKTWVNAQDTTQGRINDVYYGPLKEDYANAKVVVSTLKFTSNVLTKLFLSNFWGSSASVISPYDDTNAYLFYSVEGLDGQAMLDAAFNLLPGGRAVDLSTAYPVGQNVGQYDNQEAVDQLELAYGEAYAVEAPDQGTNEEKIEAARNLEAAAKAVEQYKVKLKDGIYRIKGLGRAANAYMYENARLKTDSVLKVKQGATAEDLGYDFYYYRVTRGENDRFTIQNVRTNRYLKGMNRLYAHSVASTQPEATFELLPWNNTSTKFTMRSSFTDANRYVLHLSGEYNVVIWVANTGTTENASVWEFEEVDPATLEEAKTRTDAYLADLAQRAEAIDSLKLYYNRAVKALDMSRTYTSAAVDDPSVIDDELTFTAWSNAGHNELGGGTDGDGIAALNDNNSANFFHSLWASGPASQIVGPYHNFYLDFGDGNAQSSFVVKLFRRPQTGNNNPTFIEVYGTNDTTNINAEATWTPVVALGNLFTSTADSATVSGGIASATPYRYYRFDVVNTMNNAVNSGKPFFSLAEINAYAATYQTAESQFGKIANAEALKSAVAAARAQVYGPTSGYTAEVFNTLRAEYNKFMADYSDLAAVVNAYNAALRTYNGSEESATVRPGYFPEGSRDEFKTAIDAARATVNETSTPEQYKEAVKTINEALANFRAKLYVPTAGELYRIRSKTDGNAGNARTPYNSYIKANLTPTAITARWDGNDTLNLENGYLQEEVDFRNEFFWQLVQGDGDSLKLQNLATGLFLKPSAYANSYGMNFDSVGANLTFMYTDKPGTFAFKFGDFYANAQPETGGSGSLVTWWAYGANSMFSVEPAEFDKTFGYAVAYYDVKPNEKALVTLPYDVKSVETKNQLDVNVYRILGLSEDKTKLVLAKVADNTAFENTAGVPFVVETADSVLNIGFDETALNLTAIPGVAAGGVQGNFNPKRINQPEYGVFNNGKIISNATAFIVRPMSAFVTPSTQTTTEAGDAFIEVDGPITNIANAIVITKSVVDVYTVDGKLVKRGVPATSATTALPAGIYVVGGVKVVVK